MCFFFKQKTAYEMRISDWSSDVCSSDLGYDEMIVLRDIAFESHCEHHMAPIIGKAHVGYVLDGKVVGISKLARVVDVFASRLQVQAKMTAQIARCIKSVLKPQGVGSVVVAQHQRMNTRGIPKSRAEVRWVGKERVRTCGYEWW